MQEEPRNSSFRTPVRRHASDRKSTRLNSSHTVISYAVFCLKKKEAHGRGSRQLISRAREHGAGCERAARPPIGASSRSVPHPHSHDVRSRVFFFFFNNRPPPEFYPFPPPPPFRI